MKEYALIRFGAGEGCDYTIGCNIAVDRFSVTGPKYAEEKARELLMPDEPEYFNGNTENGYLSSAILVKVVSEIDVEEEIYDRCRELTEAREAAEANDTERAEYERLKKKFG